MTDFLNDEEQNFKFYSIDELEELPKVNWLIDKVFPTIGLGTIYGDSGSSKSFLGLDLALSVAFMKSWFGHVIKNNISVFYICLEGQAGFKKRVQAWVKKHKISIDENNKFNLLINENFSINNQYDVKKLIRTIKRISSKQSLIIIDTFSQSCDNVDENSSKDTMSAINNLEKIYTELNALVIFIHHSGKDKNKGIRGSSAIEAALDVAIHVRREKKNRVWETKKLKDSDDNICHLYELEKIEMDSDGEIMESCVIKPIKNGQKKYLGANQLAVIKTLEELIEGKICKIFELDDQLVSLVLIDDLIENCRIKFSTTKDNQKNNTIMKVIDTLIDDKILKKHMKDNQKYLYIS